MVLQIGGGDNLSNPLGLLLFYLPLVIFFLYGQKMQTWIILTDISRSLNRLKMMKDKGRKDVLDYVTSNCKPPKDPTERVDQFLEYFTILPVDIDPSGVMRKIEHIMLVRDDRVRAEVRGVVPSATPMQSTTVENLIEAATALNLIYKVVRHFYLLGKKTTSFYVIIQLQMLMPLILQEADALVSAGDAFKQGHPIGDGIGAMVVAKMMLNKEKKLIAKETLMSEGDYKERYLYLMKAEGPSGNVGQPGNAVERLVAEIGVKLDAIIMIDAALKLEGEKSGEVSEGVGAAIGGIGVDRYKIEEVATKFNIPLYAVVIKQSIMDAISVMKKEIAEAHEKVTNIVHRIIEEKTKAGDKVLIVGVGNTLGVGQ